MKKVILKKLILFVFLLNFSSCIDFDSQTLFFFYDSNLDQLKIFQIYEGVHGESQSGLTEKEKKELDSVMEGERTFFFDNWILEFSRKSFQKAYQNLAKDEAEYKLRNPLSKEPYFLRLLLNTVLENVKVQNGKFFLNESQKLSGYQMVTINKFSEIIRQANLAINQELSQRFLNKKLSDVEKKIYALLIKRGEKNFEWLSRQNNFLVFRYPLSDQDFYKEKAKLIKEIKEEGPEKGFEILINILENPLWVSHYQNVLELRIGDPEEQVTKLSMKLKRKYQANAVSYVKEKYGIISKPDLSQIRQEFFKSEVASIPVKKIPKASH